MTRPYKSSRSNQPSRPSCLSTEVYADRQTLTEQKIVRAFAPFAASKKEPPKGMVGFGYMLSGDPTALIRPLKIGNGSMRGPHIMIFNIGEGAKNYRQQGDNPDTSAPYVMWAGTPYEHVMIPVE